MAGPGGQEGGRVSIRVLPDTTNFSRSLKAFLEKIESRTRLNIGANIDPSGVSRDLAKIKLLASKTNLALGTNLDTDGLNTKVAAATKAASGKSIRVKLDVDTASVAKLVRTVGDVTSNLSRSATKTTVFTGVGLAAAGAVPAVLQLGGALASVSGSLALMPAAGLAAGAAFATAKVGLMGFGEAMKNLGDPEKYAEAVAKLAPAARETANAVRGLAPAFKDMQLGIQQEMFRELGSIVTKVGTTYLPVLRGGMEGIAFSLGNMAAEMGQFLLQAQTIGDVRRIFELTGQSMNWLTGAVQPLLSAFRDIGVVGAQFLPGLAAGFTEATQRFAAFIAQTRQSGALYDFISSGLDAIGKLAGTLGNVGSIVYTVFNAASNAGADVLGTLQQVTGSMAAFLRSTQGATMLQQIFTGVRSALEGLGPVLSALGSAIATYIAPALAQLGPQIGAAFASLAPAMAPLGRIIAALAPLVGQLAQSFAGVLTSALTALAPIVERFSLALQQNPGLLTAVATAIGGVALAAGPLGSLIGALAPIVTGVAAAFRLLSPVLAPLVSSVASLLPSIGGLGGAFRLLFGPIGLVVGAFATLFATNEQFRGAIMGLLGAVGGLVGQLVGALAPILGVIGNLFNQVISAVAPLVTQLVSALIPVVQLVGQVLTQLIAAVMPVVTAIASALVPIIGVAAAIFGQLIAAIMPVIDTLMGILIPVIQSLMPIVQTVFGAIASIITAAMGIVQGIITTVMGVIKGDWGMVWDGIKQILSGVWDTIKAIVTGALNIVKSVISGAWNAVTAIFSGAWNAIRGVVQSGVSSVLGFISSIPGAIGGFFANAGSWLLNAGRNIVMGLYNGIRGMWDWMVGTVKNMVGGLVSTVTGMLGIHSPSRVFMRIGGYTAEGMALGIKHGTSDVVRQAERMADKATTAASGSWTGAIKSESYGNFSADVAAAVAGMQWTIDERGGRVLAKVVNRENNIQQVRRING